MTYWNDLGWTDQFSKGQFDQRQRDAVDRALAGATRPAVITLRSEGEVLQIGLPALEARCNCELILFCVRPSASTAVGSGENGGKILQEFQVVREMRMLARWQGDQRTLQVKRGRMADDVSSYAVIAQERATGRVVAAGQ